MQSDQDGRRPKRAMLLSLNIHMALDSLSFYVLTKFVFRLHFMTILWVLYSSTIASLMMKGYSSGPISIQRGTCQGCLLSPLLFVLASEPLASKIPTSIYIKGIECSNREHKCILFADDVLMMMSSPIATLPNLYAILKPFTLISGLGINHDKSQALHITLEESTL